MDTIYSDLAPLYDVIYGALLHHGRRAAIDRLAAKWGESILEIGVGTGLSAVHYPAGCSVTAIDLSAHMLRRAQTRLTRRGCRHVRASPEWTGISIWSGSFERRASPPCRSSP